jgi:hypothetical protein
MLREHMKDGGDEVTEMARQARKRKKINIML